MVVMEEIWSNINIHIQKKFKKNIYFFTLYIKFYSNPFHLFHKEQNKKYKLLYYPEKSVKGQN